MSDHLIPSLDWVEDPEKAVYDLPCPACSALVESRAVHRAWHVALVEKASQHVPPPRYGGAP